MDRPASACGPARTGSCLEPKELLPGVPRLLLPSDQRVFVFEDPLKEKVTLKLGRAAPGESYRLMISDKQLFTEVLYDARRNGTKAVIDGLSDGCLPLAGCRGLQGRGPTGPFSAPRRFRVSSQRIRDRTDNEPPKLASHSSLYPSDRW